MLTFNNYEIDLRSIPGEICLTFYICDCPCHCHGCSSPWLWQPGKRELTSEKVAKALAKLPHATCVLFMGGDNDPEAVFALAAEARRLGRTAAWYSGRGFSYAAPPHLDYYKTGPWLADYGPLNCRTTNQRLFKVHPDGTIENITDHFWTRENEWRPQQETAIEQFAAKWKLEKDECNG